MSDPASFRPVPAAGEREAMDCVWRCAQCGDLIWAGRDEFGDPTPWWHVDGPRPHDHRATPHDNPPPAAPSVVHPEPGDRPMRQQITDIINEALFCTDDGPLLSPSAEVPIGSLQQLIWEDAAPRLEALVAAAVAALRADLADQIEALREGRHPTNWNEALDAAAALVRSAS